MKASVAALIMQIALCGIGDMVAPAAHASSSPEQARAEAAAVVAQMTLAEKVSQTQSSAPAIPRLGIAAYDWWNEGLHGLARDGYATAFPQAIGLAASWNVDLLDDVGTAVSTEARAKFNAVGASRDHARYQGLTIWSPNINIFRDPRWGRGQETYGEDPYLTGQLAVSFIHGIQGDDPDHEGFRRRLDRQHRLDPRSDRDRGPLCLWRHERWVDSDDPHAGHRVGGAGHSCEKYLAAICAN